MPGRRAGLEEGGPARGAPGGLGDWSRCRGWLTGQAAPLPRADAVVRVAGHELDRRRLDHAVVLSDDASLAAFLVLDHDGPLEHSTYSNLLAVDHCVEAAADLVIEGWDDAGQRHEINDLAHKLSSLGLVGGFKPQKLGNAEPSSGKAGFYQTLRFPPIEEPAVAGGREA